MTNAFNWKGAPSIFTTGRKAHEYMDVDVRKHLATSMRSKPNTLVLPGASKYAPPEMVTRRKKK